MRSRFKLLYVALAIISVSACGGSSRKPATPAATTAQWTVTTAAGGSQLRGDVPAAVAGFKDGPAADAEFDRPVGMAAAPDGSVYVADSGNHRVRRLTVAGQVETVAGSGAAGATDGPALTATFRTPVGVSIGPDGTIYVVDAEAGQVRSIRNGEVRTVAGIDVVACRIAVEQGKASPGAPLPTGCPDTIMRQAPFRDGPGATALFNQPSSVAVGPKGDLYVADSSNQVIRRIDTAGNVSTYAGSVVGQPGNADGPLQEARFFFPVDLVPDASGALYLTEGSRVRRIDPSAGVSTLVGSRAQGMDAGGYVDGQGTAARLNAVSGLAVLPDGSLVLADTGNQRIRLVAADGVVSTVAGKGGQGMEVGPGSTAQFSQPVGVVTLQDGTILVSDYNLNRIFRITRSGK